MILNIFIWNLDLHFWLATSCVTQPMLNSNLSLTTSTCNLPVSFQGTRDRHSTISILTWQACHSTQHEGGLRFILPSCKKCFPKHSGFKKVLKVLWDDGSWTNRILLEHPNFWSFRVPFLEGWGKTCTEQSVYPPYFIIFCLGRVVDPGRFPKSLHQQRWTWAAIGSFGLEKSMDILGEKCGRWNCWGQILHPPGGLSLSERAVRSAMPKSFVSWIELSHEMIHSLGIQQGETESMCVPCWRVHSYTVWNFIIQIITVLNLRYSVGTLQTCLLFKSFNCDMNLSPFKLVFSERCLWCSGLTFVAIVAAYIIKYKFNRQ